MYVMYEYMYTCVCSRHFELLLKTNLWRSDIYVDLYMYMCIYLHIYMHMRMNMFVCMLPPFLVAT